MRHSHLRRYLPAFLKLPFAAEPGTQFLLRAIEIARQLDLFAQRQHVRIEPRADQHVGLNVLRLAVRLGLGEKAGKAA